jgi:hypothetical protein
MDFRKFKIIKTTHSKERMDERNITDSVIYNTIKYGVVLEDNVLLYNNIYLVYNSNNYKKQLIIITLIKANEHLLTKIEKNIIIKLSELVDSNDNKLICHELSICYNNFIKQELNINNNDNFTFANLLNYTEPFIINNYGRKNIYNQDKKSIVMRVLTKANYYFIDKIIDEYLINIGNVKKVYSIVIKVIKKFETKNNKLEKDILENQIIESETLDFVKSLEYIVEKYKQKNEHDKITEIVCSKSSDGYTPLMLSLYKGLDNLSYFLIANGADIYNSENNKNKRGESINDLYLMNKNLFVKTTQFFTL